MYAKNILVYFVAGMKMMRLVWHSFTRAPDDAIFHVLADCACWILAILNTSTCCLDSEVEKIT